MPGDSPPLTNEPEHSRLLTALRESEILRELAELLASSLDLDSILKVLVKRTTEVCEVERCAVWLLEDARGIFRPATYHLSSQHLDAKSILAADSLWYRSTLPFDDPVVHRLIKQNGLLALEDLHNEPSMRTIAETFLVRSVLLVALIREGRPVGMMSLDNPNQQHTFSAAQQQLARAVGHQAAIAIDNARLYQQAQAERKRAEQLIDRARAIYQVALTVNSGEDLSGVLAIATQHLVHGLDADGGAIVLLDNDMLQVASMSSTSDRQQNISSMLTTASLRDLPNCQHAATTGAPLFVTAEQAEGAEILWYRKLGLDNAMIVPLMVGIKDKRFARDARPRELEGQENPHSKDEVTAGTSRCVGLAFVNYRDSNYSPSKGQYAFAQDIAAQCALAVDKAHLLDDARQAAELANERANTLDAIFHAMTEGISVLNLDGQVVLRNNAAASFLGKDVYSPDRLNEVLQRHQAYTLHGQPITGEDFPLTRALRGERIRGERIRVQRADGSERVVEMNVAPLFDSAKQQIGIVTAFRDITQQMRVEQRIRQALETMLHVSEAVSGITDIKAILHSVLSMTLTTLNCCHGACLLYDQEQRTFTPLVSIGFSEETEKKWLAQQQQWLTPEPEQYQGFRTQLIEGHMALINAEQYPYQPNPFQSTMILAAPITHSNHLLGLMILDGSATLEDEAAQSNLKRQHEFTIWDMAVVEGIAQLAGLAIEQARWQQEALTARTSEAAMREANALKDEFLAITAHEFRTPLTVILAHSQLALRALQRATEQKQGNYLSENFTIIEEQARQLTNIVNTFLEVTQINRGQLALQLEEVDLAEIATHVVAQHAATSPDHQIRCVIEPGKQAYLVKGDSARLRQIIANLVQNAIKYSLQGGPVAVALRRFDATIEVCVEDKGIGVPQDAQARLFERFYRGPNAEESEARGIGLGLYVVAQLVQMHGGTIRVESSGVYGEGSRFIFTVPALERTVSIES